MLPLTIIRERLCKYLFTAWTLGCVLLMMPENAAIGAEGIRGMHPSQLVAIAPTSSTPSLSVNTFEISSYTVSDATSQPVEVYTEKLFTAIKSRKGLKSDVEPSDKSLIATYNECRKNNEFCDAVGVTEEKYEPNNMVLTLTVWSFGKDHTSMHPQIDGEKISCDPRRCGGREGCRANLIEEIAGRLAGLDKDHPKEISK